MLVSFDMKVIGQDQKQCRNGKVCRASMTCFWVSLMNLIPTDTKVGREIPVVVIPSGNYRSGKYSKFGQSGKYWEI